MVKRKKIVKKSKAAKRVKKTIKKAKAAKKAVRKSVAKKAKKALKAAPELGLEKIGEITHYFPHVKAAAVMILKDGLKVGDEIYIKGHTTDFKEKINSMQLDHVVIAEAKKAQEIGLLVKSRVRIGDGVYKV